MYKVLSLRNQLIPNANICKFNLSSETISIFQSAKDTPSMVGYFPQSKLLGHRSSDENATLVKCHVRQAGRQLFLTHAVDCTFDIGFVPILCSEIEAFNAGEYYVYVSSISEEHQTGSLLLFKDSITVPDAKRVVKSLNKAHKQVQALQTDPLLGSRVDSKLAAPAVAPQIDKLNQKGPQCSGLKRNVELSHGLETLIQDVTVTIETSEKPGELVDLFKKVETKNQRKIKACIDLAVQNLRDFLGILKFKEQSQQITNVELLKFQDSFPQLSNEFDGWCKELKSDIEKHQAQKAREHENKLLKKAKAQAQALEMEAQSIKKAKPKKVLVSEGQLSPAPIKSPNMLDGLNPEQQHYFNQLLKLTRGYQFGVIRKRVRLLDCKGQLAKHDDHYARGLYSFNYSETLHEGFSLINAQLKVLFKDYSFLSNFDLDQELSFIISELDPTLFDAQLLQLADYLSVLIPSKDLIVLKPIYENSKSYVLSIMKDMHHQLEMLLLSIIDYHEPWEKPYDASLLFALLFLRQALIAAEKPQSHYSVKLRADFSKIFMAMLDKETFNERLLTHLSAMQVYYYFFELMDSRYRYYETLKPSCIYKFDALPKDAWPETSNFVCQLKRGSNPFGINFDILEHLEILKQILDDFKSITQYPELEGHFHSAIQLSEYLQLTYRKVTDKTLPFLLLGLFLSDLKNMFSRPELSEEYSSSMSDSTLAVYRDDFVNYFGLDFQKLCIDVTHRLQDRLNEYITSTNLLKLFTDKCFELLPITKKDLNFMTLLKIHDSCEIEKVVKRLFSYYIPPESLVNVNQSVAGSFGSAYQQFLKTNDTFDFNRLGAFQAFNSFMSSPMPDKVSELGLFIQTAMFVSLVLTESLKYDVKRTHLLTHFTINSDDLEAIVGKVKAVLAQTKSLLEHDASLPITKDSDQPFGFDTLIEVKIVINTLLGMANESSNLSKKTKDLLDCVMEPFLTLISRLLIFKEVVVNPEQSVKVAAVDPFNLEPPLPISPQLTELQDYLLKYCLTEPKRSLVISAMAEFHSKLLEIDCYSAIEVPE